MPEDPPHAKRYSVDDGVMIESDHHEDDEDELPVKVKRYSVDDIVVETQKTSRILQHTYRRF